MIGYLDEKWTNWIKAEYAAERVEFVSSEIFQWTKHLTGKCSGWKILNISLQSYRNHLYVDVIDNIADIV